MKIIVIGFKLWVVMAILVAVCIGFLMINGVPEGGHVMMGDEELHGPTAAVAVGLAVGLAVIVLGACLAVLAAILAVVVPLTLIGLVLVLAVAAVITAASILGGGLVVVSPILIVIAACVLLVRGTRYRTRAAPPGAAPAGPTINL